MVNNSFILNSLIILLWNCNGILNHVKELIAVLHEKRIDIALITESHITKRFKLNIPSYHLISSPYPDDTTDAGAAILVRTFIHFNLYKITTIISNSGIIPNTQFSFRNFHSTIHQINRITDTILSSLEKKQYCNAVFLDRCPSIRSCSMLVSSLK